MTVLRRGILLVTILAIVLGTLMMASAKPKVKKRDAAAIALFDAIKKKGWHEVRLLDATGRADRSAQLHHQDRVSPRPFR